MSYNSACSARFSGVLFIVLMGLTLAPKSLRAQAGNSNNQALIVEQALIRAMTRAYAGDFAEAEAILQQGLRVEPKNPSLLSEMAYVKEQTGTLSAALFYQSLAVENDSVHVSFSTDLARLQMLSGDVHAAISTYSQAVGRYPSDVRLKLLFARTLIRLDRLQDALVQIDAALNHVEFRIESLSIGADIARMLGRNTLLEKYETELVALDPFGQSYPRALAELFMRQGRWEEAVDAFERAMDLDPTNTDLQEAVADARMRMDRASLESETANPTINSARPDSTSVTVGSIDADSRLTTISILRENVQNSPDDTNALRALADAYLEQSAFTDAAPLLRRIVDLDPRNLDAWRLGIESYATSGNLKTALVMSEDALSLFPGYVPVMILRVDTLEKAKQFEEAILILEALIERTDNKDFEIQLKRIRSKIRTHQ